MTWFLNLRLIAEDWQFQISPKLSVFLDGFWIVKMSLLLLSDICNLRLIACLECFGFYFNLILSLHLRHLSQALVVSPGCLD
jgi:hypothetical protein